MPFIAEVSSVWLQRFYTGLITLRNQLVTPIKTIGRRVVELYDALLSGNDWEVTPLLSLKRRAGHTLYQIINYPAMYLYSWKSNTMGTIPIIDTTGDIEFISASGPGTIYTKAPTFGQGVESSVLGIGNYLYVGNPQVNFKWDGPTGPQGKTNWGISIINNSGTAMQGPNVAGSGQNTGSGVSWTNPANVSNTGVSYATVTTTSPSTLNTGAHSGSATSQIGVGWSLLPKLINPNGNQALGNFAFNNVDTTSTAIVSGFGFSIPGTATITGVLINYWGQGHYGGNPSFIRTQLMAATSVLGNFKDVSVTNGTWINVNPGSASDQWGSVLTPAIVNNANFGIGFIDHFGESFVYNVQVTVYYTVANGSKILEAYNFAFSGLTGNIQGIQVSFNGILTGGDGTSAMSVSLMSNQVLVGLPKPATLITPVQNFSFGSAFDSWNSFLPVSVLNNSAVSGFGVGFSASGNGSWSINDVVVTVWTNSGLSPSPTGVGSFSAVNGYTYVQAYGNATSGEVSNASTPSNNTGPFTNVAYVGVPVTASPDPQVNQIRVYRTTDTGGGNQFFEISNSPFPNVNATIQDTTPDTQLQVTSQAEINLGNTPPPAGLTNLAWWAGRMWGSVNNVLFASTGPETISGTAPNSNWNPAFQYVIPGGTIVRNVPGPNGMFVCTLDEWFIVRGTDIINYTVNEFVKDFGIRSYNAVDTDGTNLYVFTTDRQFICVTSAGADDIGLAIADQLAKIDPSSVYVTVNRFGLDSVVRVLDTVNNLYYDYNLNQQCWNLPGLLQMPNCSAMGSIEVAPGVWRLLLSTTTTGNTTSLAYRDITNFQDLGASYSPVAVFGSITLCDPGNLAKFGGRGGFCMEFTSAGTVPTLAVLPNDTGVTLSNAPGAQVTGNFTTLSVGGNPLPSPPTLGLQPKNYRSLIWYWSVGKALSAFVKHLQIKITAPAENFGTELIGMGIFGDEKSESGAPGKIPEIQGR